MQTESVQFACLHELSGLGAVAVAGLLASIALAGLRAFAPGEFTQFQDMRLNPYGLAASALLVAVACTAIMAVPYLRILAGSTAAGGAPHGHSDQRGLVGSLSRLLVFQVSLATMLLVGAGLMTHSFWQLVGEEKGFDSTSALTMQVGFPPQQFYRDREQGTQVYDRVIERVRAVPGVVQVGAVDRLPLAGLSNVSTTLRYGDTSDNAVQADYRWINGDYIEAMGIPLLSGRLCTETDRSSNAKVAVINSTLARNFWPGSEAVGQRMKRWSTDWHTVIGVVGDVRNDGLDTVPRPQVYFCSHTARMTMVVRASGAPRSLAGPIQSAIREVDPLLVVSDIQTMADLVGRSVSVRQFSLFLAGSVAFVAAVLALFGIVSLITYSIEKQSHAIGVRLALGASVERVSRSYVRRTLILVSAGMAVGVAAAQAGMGMLEGLLYEVGRWDFAGVGGACLVLLLASYLAAALVSRRIGKLAPGALLRPQ